MLSLECKDRLFEASTMEMCIQGIKWDLLYILQMSKPWTFQELATKAHNTEVTMANYCGNSFDFANSKKDKAEFRRNVNFSKNLNKESMSISKVEPIGITKKTNRKRKEVRPSMM